MARPLRLQAPGIYHVTCRGNRRQPIFTDDYDRERYLALLTAVSRQLAQAYNRRHGWVGHLFQGRFHSVVVEAEGHSLELTRYVVLNPERAGAVARAVDWHWSSHRALLGQAAAPAFLDTMWTLRQFSHNPARARAAYR